MKIGIKRTLALGAMAALGLTACDPGTDGGPKGGCQEDRGHGSSSRRGGGDGGRRGDDLQVVGLTNDQRLICFEEDKPDKARTLGQVSGLTGGDTRLVGIDYRPATGALYGLGNAGGVYVLDDRDGSATLRSRLNVALSGSSFGVDFNPAVDRLRVISDTGQNLRINVDTGATLVDGTLTYPANPPASPNPTTGTGITGAAYTNNDSDANTGTTLYDIDSMLDQVVIQSPANAGLLAPTGKLTVDTTTGIGFDIYSTVRDGSTVDVQALASLTVGGQVRLYGITLFNGRATSQGAFDPGDQVIGIAIPLNQL